MVATKKAMNGKARADPNDRRHFSMSKPNSQWRVNQQGMERCCIKTLEYEMYRRGDQKEPLMVEGQTLRCSNCNSELICDPSLRDGRLRWRWKANG